MINNIEHKAPPCSLEYDVVVMKKEVLLVLPINNSDPELSLPARHVLDKYLYYRSPQNAPYLTTDERDLKGEGESKGVGGGDVGGGVLPSSL